MALASYDYVVVGAGLAGATAAERLATGLRQRVLVIEKRGRAGGNCHDGYDEHGVLVHTHGPHVFHTKRPDVWNYLSGFTTWRLYQHRVRCRIEGKEVPLPFNLNTIDQVFPAVLSQRLTRKLIEERGYGERVSLLELREARDPDLQRLWRFVYDNVFLNYTMKQWGCKPEDLAESVTARVPIVISRDDRYFRDPYQGIPAEGYTRMVERMLQAENVHLLLNTDCRDVLKIGADGFRLFGAPFAGKVVYTGPIDSLMGYEYGVLPYRSLRLEFEHLPQPVYQSVATINYPNDYDFTRITEFKHLTGQAGPGTTILREFPIDYDPNVAGKDTPYYCVQKPGECEAYRKYAEAAGRVPGLILLGRLAEYRYYNMDEVVGRGLDVIAEQHS